MATPLEICAAAAVVEAPSAPVTPSTGASSSAGLDGASPPAKKRARAPKIDIDTAIKKHLDEVKRASKLVNDAKRAARNERRRKSRLMKKAATLTPEDLERIAVLKRCGLYNPAEDTVVLRAAADPAATPPGAAEPVAAAAAAATPEPESPGRDEGAGSNAEDEDEHE